MLWKLVLRQKPDLAALNDERVLFEIDAGLMSFEHVESEQQVDISALFDRVVS